MIDKGGYKAYAVQSTYAEVPRRTAFIVAHHSEGS